MTDRAKRELMEWVETVLQIAAVGLLVFIVVLIAGCQTADNILLEPMLDDRQIQFYQHEETGVMVPQDQIPDGDELAYFPVYAGPKDTGDIEHAANTGLGLVGLAGLGGLLPLIVSAYWTIRRRRQVIEAT
jgi:hypothetical protein